MNTPIYDALCFQYMLSEWVGLWHVEDPFCIAWDKLCGALGDWDQTGGLLTSQSFRELLL
jgi:hypothetical protein